MTRIILLLISISILTGNLYAQDIQGPVVRGTIVDGDTIAYLSLPVVRVYAPKIFRNNREERQWNRLVRNVKKAYPYALIAGNKMNEYEAQLIGIASERERKKLMKIAEDDLKAQFEKDIRNLTFSQGKILIKLIDRETGQTSYSIIKDFRGTISALFWQSIARIFTANLKDEYDPIGEDRMIEEIVVMIENGDL
ncbi:MAG: DUF4294 domain-containing protein [Bacteroidales bacterium]|nr:DUF4294 domain-containing protein [Bacteroidales bacterium]